MEVIGGIVWITIIICLAACIIAKIYYNTKLPDINLDPIAERLDSIFKANITMYEKTRLAELLILKHSIGLSGTATITETSTQE